MPSASKSQRRLAGMTLASRQGMSSSPMSSGMMDMSMQDLRDYATSKGKKSFRKKGKKKGKGC